MKIHRIRLLYPDGTDNILHKESDLEKFDLSKASSFEVDVQMTRYEFDRLRGMGQIIGEPTSTNPPNVSIRLDKFDALDESGRPKGDPSI